MTGSTHDWFDARVLVTVKTYPTPSVRHKETVCVAGVRLDTPLPEWVRLYPIPFRTKEFDYEFKKYQVIDVPLRKRGSKDPRPESHQPNNEKITLGEVVKPSGNWKARRQLLGNLVGETSTCELVAINRATPMNKPAPSLGLIKPVDVRLSIQDGKEWTKPQQSKVDAAAAPDLFSDGAVKTPLEPAPYQIRARYKCLEGGCLGHNQTIIDWEVGAAAYQWRRRYPESELAGRLLAKWEAMMDPGKDVHFFVGNQHQYRHSFSILGTWYPKL
ncbi:hypothetical protein K0651_01775 [Ornithinimicrobium sp. Arc0846-15]|nr:hypothetical protein [Ornithinimicrobium laminariae]